MYGNKYLLEARAGRGYEPKLSPLDAEHHEKPESERRQAQKILPENDPALHAAVILQKMC